MLRVRETLFHRVAIILKHEHVLAQIQLLSWLHFLLYCIARRSQATKISIRWHTVHLHVYTVFVRSFKTVSFCLRMCVSGLNEQCERLWEGKSDKVQQNYIYVCTCTALSWHFFLLTPHFGRCDILFSFAAPLNIFSLVLCCAAVAGNIKAEALMHYKLHAGIKVWNIHITYLCRPGAYERRCGREQKCDGKELKNYGWKIGMWISVQQQFHGLAAPCRKFDTKMNYYK